MRSSVAVSDMSASGASAKVAFDCESVSRRIAAEMASLDELGCIAGGCHRIMKRLAVGVESCGAATRCIEQVMSYGVKR